MTKSSATLSLIAFLALQSGCALLTKSDPLTARYFSPEPSGASADPPVLPHAAPSEGGVERELRLGRVTSASYLGERLVFRNSNYELGFYEDLRWTEKPEVYLRRALSRAFFEEGGLRHVMSGPGPTLEVELVEFAELNTPAHVARVRAAYVLYDERAVRSEATVSIDLPIPAVGASRQTSETVRILAEGLVNVVGRIVVDVTAHLTSPSNVVKADIAQ